MNILKNKGIDDIVPVISLAIEGKTGASCVGAVLTIAPRPI